MKADVMQSGTQPMNEGGPAVSVVRDSLTGSLWTVVSRVTGLGQSIAVATVLGATYLGNTYQAINSLPNIIYYQLLAGSLFASILVPPLVSRRDRGDAAATEALAQGFYGALLAGAAVFCLLLILAGPAILHVFAVGVADPTTAALQRRVGLVFLVIFVPQIALYVTAGTGAAVMNAHGRFALAAGAPALENLGMISTLILAGVLFGTGTDLGNVTTPQVLLLGLGTTVSVGIHAGAQWLGARSCDVRLRPRAGWRDPEVRRVLRRVVPTLGYTGLAASQTVAVLVLANRLAGGLVAFQLALNFFYLPVAVVAWPIARSMLPHVARLTSPEDGPAFWDELCRAVRLASFVVVPMAVAYLVLATPIARAIAMGQLEADGGVPLVAMSLAALGLGVIGETWFVLGTYAFYARQDARAPLRSMLVRVGVAAAVLSIALITKRPAVLLVLGLAMSLGSVIGSIHLWARLRASSGGTLAMRPLARTVIAACIMAVPAALTAEALSRWIGAHELGQVGAVVGATLIGAVAYLLAQKAFAAPELALLKSGITRFVRSDNR
jgi:putative peptidoglycan lipid II flippase